ncbi:uncharacterized protein An07g03790 [Aspergillus niger]|uniref:Contig An07c0100, genomic contig n=2 Tax=Aspergillus niger TaxID=5061 RepID=A2QMY8_ASPNC|nr:uncharacterized protein An07g03790 [Aspergillus niger]CAK48129.1 unnamed protein product [Aspergillus niger]
MAGWLRPETRFCNKYRMSSRWDNVPVKRLLALNMGNKPLDQYILQGVTKTIKFEIVTGISSYLGLLENIAGKNRRFRMESDLAMLVHQT